jgi:protein TonB
VSASGQGLGGPGELAGFGELWLGRPVQTRSAFIGTGVALAIHATVAALLVQVDTSRLLRGDETVEMEVKEKPLPPPEVRPEPPPPPPPPEVKPRVVMHKAPAPPPEAPPPPSEAPPKPSDAPPVFGVAMSSVVSGDGPGMAVPVGNTLMTKPRKAPPPAAPLPASGQGDGLPAPVPEIYISEPPHVVHEITAPYPPELQRMGIEGVVVATLYIDENGDVRRVKITEKAGHGFDELARDALKKFKFSPGRTSDGKASPTNITYKYRFELPQ